MTTHSECIKSKLEKDDYDRRKKHGMFQYTTDTQKNTPASWEKNSIVRDLEQDI